MELRNLVCKAVAKTDGLVMDGVTYKKGKVVRERMVISNVDFDILNSEHSPTPGVEYIEITEEPKEE
jgi:hypothetical protein